MIIHIWKDYDMIHPLYTPMMQTYIHTYRMFHSNRKGIGIRNNLHLQNNNSRKIPRNNTCYQWVHRWRSSCYSPCNLRSFGKISGKY